MFLPEAILGFEAMGHTVEAQVRKAVQMHSLAQNFVLKLKELALGPHLTIRMFTWVKVMMVNVSVLKNS